MVIFVIFVCNFPGEPPGRAAYLC